MLDLEVEYGLAEWRAKGEAPRRYKLGCLETEKLLLADLTEAGKEIGRALLDDLCSLTEKTKAETLVIALAAMQPAAGHLVRSLLVFGFEAVSKEEAQRFTSRQDVVLMRMEVNQEDDFVDLD